MSRVAVFAIVCATAFGLSRVTIQAGQETTKTTWDGVYSADQAAKGEGLYNQGCAKCHGAGGMGSDAPPLADPGFQGNWDGQTVISLFDRVRNTMPMGAEGTLTRDETSAIVAYLFQRNNFPAGEQELGTAGDALATIKYVATKPR